MANNFKVFAENSENVYTDVEWAENTVRENGSQPEGVIASKENNTALRETSLLCTALINALEALDTRVSPSIIYSLNDTLADFTTKLTNVVKSFTKDYTDSSCTTALNNAKTYADNQISSAPTVRYVSQSLSDSQKLQARVNIGAGTSSFNGNYNNLTNKPDLKTVATTGSYGDLINRPTLYLHSIRIYVETNTENRYETTINFTSGRQSYDESSLASFFPVDFEISNNGIYWYQYDSEYSSWSLTDKYVGEVSFKNVSGQIVPYLDSVYSTNWGIVEQSFRKILTGD